MHRRPTFNYLNSQGINRHLIPSGLYYGAGYGRRLKPTFFLGTIKEQRLSGGYTIIVLERELAWTYPWPRPRVRERLLSSEWTPYDSSCGPKSRKRKSGNGKATDMALFHYGWNPSLPPDRQLDWIVQSEMETILFHETGEAMDRSFPQGLWRLLLVHFPFSRIELYLRTLKDLLADTHSGGTINFIIRETEGGSLGFYLSNLKGLRRSLFPEIVNGDQRIQET